MNPILRWWTLFAALASAAALGAAHAFEHWGHLSPCAMCLKQRDVYWAALALAVPATLWGVVSRSRGTPRITAFLLFGVFTAGAIVAGFHAGGEWHLWPLPATCSGKTAGIDVAAMQAFNGGAVTSAPMCDVAAWRWLGISMAGWNALISVLLATLSLIAAKRPREARAPRG